MPKLAQRTTYGVWRMFPKFGYTRIPSSRLNCKEPNLLAMPNRTKRGRQVCEGFITDPGWVYLSVDESQIEPRVVAHRSGDPNLRAVYHNEEDIYSDFAIAAFRLPDTRFRDADGWHYPGVDKKLHRFPSKTCTLAAIYDVTNVGLLDQMPVVCAGCHKAAAEHYCDTFRPLWDEDLCQNILNAFYLRYPYILRMRKQDHARARTKGYLWDEWGRILHITAVRSVLEWVVSAGLREAGNFPIQSTAQGTVKLAMAQVYDEFTDGGLWDICHPLLQIHDELLFEVREDYADEIAGEVKRIFEHCVRLEVDIKASSATSLNWGALQK
jgi:DNA polymerase-1